MIPIVLVFGYYTVEIIQNNERQVFDHLDQMAEKSALEVNNEINILNQYCNQIPANYSLMNLLNGDGSAYTDRLICDALNQVFYMNDFAQWIYLYDEKQGKIYSGSEMYLIDRFNTNKDSAYFRNWDYDDMIELLDNLQQFKLHADDSFSGYFKGTAEETITIMLPLGTVYRRMVLMAIINQSTLEKIMENNYLEEDAYMVMSHGTQELARVGDQGMAMQFEAEKEEFLFSSHNAGGKLQVMIAQPRHTINSRLTVSIQKAGVLLLISLIMIGAALWLIISYIYKPIKEISREADLRKDPGSSNELLLICQKLREIQKEIRPVTEGLKESNFRSDIMMCFLNGELNDYSDLYKIGCSVRLFEARFQVVMISEIVDNLTRDTVQNVHQFIHRENKEDSGCEIYKYIFFNGLRIITVLGVADRQFINKASQEISNSFQYIIGKKVRTGIGNVKRDGEGIKSSYKEALMAVEAAVMKEEAFLLYSDLDQYQIFYVPEELRAQIELAFMSQEITSIEKCKNRICEFIRKPDVHCQGIMFAYSYIRDKFFALYAKYAEQEEKEQMAQVVYQNVNSIGNMEKAVNLLFEMVTLKLASNPVLNEKYDAQEVLSYVNERMAHMDFSIADVAQHFSAPVSSFSLYFKQQFGIGFKEYVDKRKMELAKERLKMTNDSLQMIAERLNYANASNFSRAFKQMEGMTPGEYRKKSQSERDL